MEPGPTTLAQSQGRTEQRRDSAMGRTRRLPRPCNLERTTGVGLPDPTRGIPGPRWPNPTGNLPGVDPDPPTLRGRERTEPLGAEPRRWILCGPNVASPRRPLRYDLAVQPQPLPGQRSRTQRGRGELRPPNPQLDGGRSDGRRAGGVLPRSRTEPRTYPVPGRQPSPTPTQEKTPASKPIGELADITFLRSSGVTWMRLTYSRPRCPGP